MSNIKPIDLEEEKDNSPLKETFVRDSGHTTNDLYNNKVRNFQSQKLLQRVTHADLARPAIHKEIRRE